MAYSGCHLFAEWEPVFDRPSGWVFLQQFIEKLIEKKACKLLPRFFQITWHKRLHNIPEGHFFPWNLIFSHVNEQPWRVMEKNGFIEKVGADNFCAHIDDALKRAEQL